MESRFPFVFSGDHFEHVDRELGVVKVGFDLPGARVRKLAQRDHRFGDEGRNQESRTTPPAARQPDGSATSASASAAGASGSFSLATCVFQSSSMMIFFSSLIAGSLVTRGIANYASW